MAIDMNGFGLGRIAVIGDFCLDVYWHADMTKSELSRETPHFPLPIVEERLSPGGAGNVVMNLLALEPKSVTAIGVFGDDWRGAALKGLLAEAGADLRGVVTDRKRVTNTYIKPLRKGFAENVVYEDPRLDFANYSPLDPETEGRLLAALDQIAKDVDVLCVCDQMPIGVITPAIRRRIIALGRAGLRVFVDSRDRIGLYRHVIVKPNEIEAARVFKGKIGESEFEKLALTLQKRTCRPAIVTAGERGCFVAEGKVVRQICACRVTGEIDFCGAGDTFLSGLAVATAAGCSLTDAASIACCCSAITIKKLKTTGTATRREILPLLKKRGLLVKSVSLLVVAFLSMFSPSLSAQKLPERKFAFGLPSKLESLPPGAIEPQGWLRDWCVTARRGYISRLDEVDQAFPRAWNSEFHPRGPYLDWGDPDKGAWCTEGGAYWFEGLVKLAWQLNDAELKAYAIKRLTPLLEKMNPNAIGFVYWLDRRQSAHFEEIERANHGFIIGASGRSTRAFLAYYEATGDERALQALKWCHDEPRAYFYGNPVSMSSGAADTWRYCGDEKLAAALENFFVKYRAIDPDTWPALRYGHAVTPKTIHMRVRRDSDPNRDWEWRLQHGVLSHESLYAFLKLAQWKGDGKLFGDVRSWLEFFEQNTRQVHGVTVADEQYGWPGANRGTETCTVAGDILLYLTMAGATGEGRFADHVERSFLNAGAVCTSRDYMHHVYFQSPNRTAGNGRFHAGPASSGGAYKTKHWPLCCTAALNRILPGFVEGLWMKGADGSLAATLYAPNRLTTDLAGKRVSILTETDYPFTETLRMTVDVDGAMRFPLKLRVPAWCGQPEITVNGGNVQFVVGKDGFATVSREWKRGDAVLLTLPMAARVERVCDRNDGDKNYCAVLYGPLLMAAGIPEIDENTPCAGARTSWSLDSAQVANAVEVIRKPMPKFWNWPFDAPLKLRVKAADGSPLELIPYGSARLRVSLFTDIR